MNKLSLHIGSEISLKDFSFSQLIIAVKNLFDTEGVPGLMKVLVILIEKMLLSSGVECPHCGGKKYHHNSKQDRRLKTSIGEVTLTLSRVLCGECSTGAQHKIFDRAHFVCAKEIVANHLMKETRIYGDLFKIEMMDTFFATNNTLTTNV